jgi:hypothetical protein
MVCVFGQVRGGAERESMSCFRASWLVVFPSSLDGVNQMEVGGRSSKSDSSRVAIVGDGGNLDYLSTRTTS